MAFLDNSETLKESQTLEFKEAAAGLPDDIWESYSAFANTEGGKIILGVHENKTTRTFSIAGVANPSELIDTFWSTVRSSQKVTSDVLLPDDVREVTVEGRSVVVIDVPRASKADKPVRVHIKKADIAFVRRGTTDQKATEREIQQMEYDKAYLADRAPLNEIGIDALDPKTIARYREVAAATKAHSPWNSDSDEDFLYHIGGLAKGWDGLLHPTKAGLLAFGFEHKISGIIPHYRLDYREETEGDLRWTDRVMSQDGNQNGNLIDFYFTMVSKIAKLFKAPFSTDETGMRHGSRNPITECVNEAIVNGLVHAWYGLNAKVTIVVKNDSITVSNSGSLLIDKGVAISGGFSEPRNPTLMRIFNYIGAGDQAGSGLCTIWKNWYSAFEKTPVLTEKHSPSYVELVLPMQTKRALSQSSLSSFSEYELLLVKVIEKAESPITAADVAKNAGISIRKAQEVLLELTKNQKSGIGRTKIGRSFHYYIDRS